MNLLASLAYDPAVAVTRATTALLAMTAIDTTNARLTGTVPLSGKLYWKIKTAIHGAATYPQVLLGILSGATVVARAAAMLSGGNLAATSICAAWAEGTINGLTPGNAFTYDAAYAVETLVAATGIKYGGPNDTTANNAFGAFIFEIYDPCPVFTPAAGAAPTTTVHQKLDANTTTLATIAGYLDTEIAAILAAVDTEVAAIKAKTDQLTFTIANKVDSSIQAAGDFAQAAADRVWSTAARSLTTFGTLAADVWAVATRTLTAASDSSGVTTLLSRLSAGRATNLDNLDAAVSTRLASAGYTAPPTAAAIRAEIDANSAGLAAIFTRTDVATSTRLASANYTAPDNAGIAAIKTQSDQLGFTGGNVHADVKAVKATTVTGSGTPADPWNP
jgi:hypothetical protein